MDESHFKVSLTVRDKVTRQSPQTTTFEEKGEPKRIRTEVPLLADRKLYFVVIASAAVPESFFPVAHTTWSIGLSLTL